MRMHICCTCYCLQVPTEGTNAPQNTSSPINGPSATDATNTTSATDASNTTSDGVSSGPETLPDEDATTPFRPNGTLQQVDPAPGNSTEDKFGFIPHSNTGLHGGHGNTVPPSPPTPANDPATTPMLGGNGTAADPNSLPPVNKPLQSPEPVATSTDVIEPTPTPTTSTNNAVSPAPVLGPGYTEPYYLALAGSGKAFPDFSQSANQIKVAEALRSALYL